MKRILLLAVWALVAGETTACELVERGFGTEERTAVRAVRVAEGLEVPWAVAFLPDGRALVTERPGRLRIGRLAPGSELETVEAPVAIRHRGEGGLMGVTLHPDFRRNRLFYLYFTTDRDGKAVNRLQRFRLSADGRRAEAGRILLDGVPAAKFHNGGRIRFGADGLLYVATGDARDPKLAQDPSSLAGKLLRLTPDGGVPEGNPFGSPVYLMGIRNLQGFDWLPGGRVILADHGPSGEWLRFGGDEVSVAGPGDNLGWPTLWKCGKRRGLVSPLLAFDRAAPPGGAVYYTGDGIPEWKNSFLVATLKSRHIHRLVVDAAGRLSAHSVHLKDAHGRFREIVQGPDGALYVTTSNCDNRARCPAHKDVVLRLSSGATDGGRRAGR